VSNSRLYTRITASEVRRQLIAQCGYTDEELPTSETIRRKLNDLGYTLKRVLKTKPIKKIPETEAIFEQVEEINTEADNDPHTLRISLMRRWQSRWENLTEVVQLGCQQYH
jgi:hypothetical protein